MSGYSVQQKALYIVRRWPWELALLLIVSTLAFTVKEFASSGNLSNILIQISPILLLAVGQSFVLVTGGIDLSQGAAVGIGSVLLFMFMGAVGLPSALILLLVIAAIYYGSVAALITLPRGGFNPLIVTLATMYMLLGIVMFATGGTPLVEISESSKLLFEGINSSSLLGVPVSFVIAAGALSLSALFLHRTTTGILIFAVGDNPVAAQAHGLSILQGRVWAYVVNGLLTMLACFLLTSRIFQGNPHLGEGLLFDSVGGAVLGGVSLAGGVGGVWYAVRGVLLIFLIQNALYLTDMDSNVRNIAVGTLILVGYALSQLKKK